MALPPRAGALLALALTGCLPTTLPDPCDPNPCQDANKQTCVAKAGEALCLCDEGFITRPSGACEEVNAGNCPEHGGDGAEPDECMARAQGIASGEPAKAQAIDPVGDYDFFRFDAKDRNVYAVTVVPKGSSVLSPRIDVFERTGDWVNWGERAGAVQLNFLTRTGGSASTVPYYFRVTQSPLDPSVATGEYTVTLSDLGPEDYGDDATESGPVTAQAAPPSTTTRGDFRYGGDQDWFHFAGQGNVNYTLHFVGPGPYPFVDILTGSNPARTISTQQANTTFDLYNGEIGRTVYVVLYAPAALGTYEFSLSYSPK